MTRRRISLVLLTTVVAIAVALVSVFRMAQWEPSFYDQAIKIESSRAAEARDEFEQNVLALHNDIVDRQPWRFVLTADQINGWLAVDMPEKFPHALPDPWHDPRIEIRAGEAEIACRYATSKVTAVVSVVVEATLTEEPRVVAVRICHARVGALPVLKKKLIDRLTRQARRVGIPLRWTQVEKDPVALITLTPPEDSKWGELQVSSLELREGELVLTGESVPPREDDAPAETPEGDPRAPSRDEHSPTAPAVGDATVELEPNHGAVPSTPRATKTPPQSAATP